jgi:hypothetical protein
MIKNILILTLVVINGTLIYAYLMRQPTTIVKRIESAAQTTPKPLESVQQQQAPSEIALLTQEEDFTTLAAQLRERSLSEDLVRQMVLAAINRDFLAEAQSRQIETPYWQRPERDRYETVMVHLSNEETKRRLLLEIFGEDIVEDPVFADLFKPLSETLDFLSSDKQIALDSLRRSGQAASTVQGTGFLREDRTEIRATAADLNRAIQELLTTDEYLEVQLRDSRLAQTLKRNMDGMDYGEQEFRDIFQIRHALESNTERVSGPGGREAYIATREATNEQVRDYLGDKRFTEYERLQDPLFRSLKTVGERYNASDTDVVAVYDISNQANSQIRELSQKKQLTAQETRQRIEKIQAETQSEIVDLVGEDAAKSVLDNTRRYNFRRSGRGNR